MKELLQRAKELEPELLENRRWLHRHPELGFELKETCAFVEEKLKAMGYAPQRMSKAGIVATVGKTGGKTILLRADMDALPMKEESGLDFSATGNAAHTCGHDTHTAMLLAAAKMLKEREEELNGCVKLMFQPDEEGTNPLGFSGAQAMLKDGILENPHVDAVVSMHIMSQSPYSAGTIYTRRGPMMSSCDTITITITGKGTHGSMPQEGVDALNVGVHIYSALHASWRRRSRACSPSAASTAARRPMSCRRRCAWWAPCALRWRPRAPASKSASRPSARAWRRRSAPKRRWNSRRASQACTTSPH